MQSFTKYLLPLLFLLPVSKIKSQSYLKFAGTNAYVTFGNNSKLGLSSFTLECWFQRQGTGTSTSTGTGGVTAIPLITKGRSESDASTVDCNYFFGINTTGNVLTADFEEGSGGSTPGLNHPISGVTAIQNNVWYHGAVTYNGSTWNLYLNGNLEASLTVSQPCQNLSIQHASLATAQNSTGAVSGFFNGALDEARVWNFAKTQAQIRATINSQIYSPQTGLVARWGLDENKQIFVRDTSGNNVNGTIKGTGYTWVAGAAPFNVNFAPTSTVSSPQNTCLLDSATLGLNISDTENDTITVKFFARTKVKSPPKFTFIPIPDTQFYTEQSNGGSNAIFKAQTNWIVAQKDSLNIKYVCQLGDCAQNGDNGGNDIEYKRADTSMRIIEDSIATKLKDGIPYTMCVGNHDQSPGGDALGTTLFFNQYFGVKRFSGRNYYGGVCKNSADNNFQLFSASGIDFISISFEYDTKADTNVLKWADSLLKIHSTRKGVIVCHWIINADGTFGAQGQAIYNRLRVNPNLMIMLCGHINPNGEARRTDVYNGISVPTLLSDYQDRTNGGNGWLRIMTFNPDNNTVDVKTYSPTLKQYETDANSQFTVTNLNLFPGTPYNIVSTQTLIGGNGAVNYKWKNLLADTTYEWYAEVSDRKNKITTPLQNFTTRKPIVNLGNDVTLCGALTLNAGNAGKQYLWNNIKTTQAIVADTSGKYFVKVTNPVSSCSTSDTINITINSTPKVNLGKDSATCEKPVLLNASNNGMNYLWNNNSTGQTLLATNSNKYIVKVTNPVTNCFASDTINIAINANPKINLGKDTAVCVKTLLNAKNTGNKVKWSNGDTAHTINILGTSNNAVMVTNPVTGCFATDTIFITVNPLPIVNLGNDIINCGGPVILDAKNNGSTFLWSDNSTVQILTVTQSGKYAVKVKHATTCENKDTINITIKPVPVKPVISGKTNYCTGETLQSLKAIGSDVIWYSDSTKSNVLARGNNYYPQASVNTFLYATQTVNDCVSGISKTNLVFYPVPTVSISNTKFDYYDTDSSLTLIGQPVGGSFKGFGVYDNRFYPANAGIGGPYIISYNYTSPKGCSNSTSIALNVKANPLSILSVIRDADLTLYPNPTKDETTLRLHLQTTKEIEISITDLSGKSISIQPLQTMQAGEYKFTINRQTLGLASGAYTIQIKSGTEQNNLKVIFE